MCAGVVAYAAVALFSGIAHAEDEELLLRADDTVAVELATGIERQVLLSENGRPTNCPAGSLWADAFEVGAVVSECVGESQYQIIESEDFVGTWALIPWPRPIDDDDSGPRVR